MSCFYCVRDERLTALMSPLAEFPWSRVYLFNDQKHPGRCVIALREHREELWQLSDAERSGFFAEVSLTSEAIARVCGADKMNYATYGDKVPHFHVHLVPKKKDGLQWGGPFTDTLPVQRLPAEEFKALGERIFAQLTSLADAKRLPPPARP